jgi:ArsR family transcriptional regulator
MLFIHFQNVEFLYDSMSLNLISNIRKYENMNATFVKDEELESAVAVFSALGSTKRLQIVFALEGGEKSVSEISDVLSCRQSCTSQHLSVLKNSGIVSARREGHEVYYRICKPCVLSFLSCLISGECTR